MSHKIIDKAISVFLLAIIAMSLNFLTNYDELKPSALGIKLSHLLLIIIFLLFLQLFWEHFYSIYKEKLKETDGKFRIRDLPWVVNSINKLSALANLLLVILMFTFGIISIVWVLSLIVPIVIFNVIPSIFEIFSALHDSIHHTKIYGLVNYYLQPYTPFVLLRTHMELTFVILLFLGVLIKSESE